MIPEEATPSEGQNPGLPEPEESVAPSEPKMASDAASLHNNGVADSNRFNEEYGKGIVASLVINGVIFIIFIPCLGLHLFEYGEGIRRSMETSSFAWFGLIGFLALSAVVSIRAKTKPEFINGFIAGYALIFFITLLAGIFLTGYCLSQVI